MREHVQRGKLGCRMITSRSGVAGCVNAFIRVLDLLGGAVGATQRPHDPPTCALEDILACRGTRPCWAKLRYRRTRLPDSIRRVVIQNAQLCQLLQELVDTG